MALQYVVLNHLGQLLLLFFAALGVAIAWQVNQIPLTVDQEVVDEYRLARGGRGHGQLLVARQHVDEAALAHIAAANEGKLRLVSLNALIHTDGARVVFGSFYLHHSTSF